jgi:hypothetical protein
MDGTEEKGLGKAELEERISSFWVLLT